jgi:hypothetical protein
MILLCFLLSWDNRWELPHPVLLVEMGFCDPFCPVWPQTTLSASPIARQKCFVRVASSSFYLRWTMESWENSLMPRSVTFLSFPLEHLGLQSWAPSQAQSQVLESSLQPWWLHFCTPGIQGLCVLDPLLGLSFHRTERDFIPLLIRGGTWAQRDFNLLPEKGKDGVWGVVASTSQFQVTVLETHDKKHFELFHKKERPRLEEWLKR